MKIYEAVKNMPNPSQGLLRLLKSSSNARIWMTGEKDTSFKELKEASLREFTLRLGSPDREKVCQGYVRARCFEGVLSIRSLMFGSVGRKITRGYLIGLGEKDKGVVMIDVTDRVVKELNEVGACAVSTAHCEMVLISKKVKECKYCGRKQKMKVYWSRYENWGDVI